MQRTSAIPTIVWSILIIVISGCATQPNYSVSDNLPKLSNNMSRIVLTREKQLAGTGSTVVFLDIGTNIYPNGLIYMAGIDVEKILDVEEFATIAGIQSNDILLWFNAELLTTLKCAKNSENCVNYDRRWPIEDKAGFLYGTGWVLGEAVSDQVEQLTKAVERIRNNTLPTISVWKTSDFAFRIVETPQKYFSNSPPYVATDSIDPEFFIIPEVNKYVALAHAGTLELTATRSNGEWTKESVYTYRPIDNEQLSRNVQVIGSTEVGDTLVWDRRPGIMRLGSAWHDGLGFMPKNIEVEAGSTYYLRYTTRLGQRWELEKVE